MIPLLLACAGSDPVTETGQTAPDTQEPDTTDTRDSADSATPQPTLVSAEASGFAAMVLGQSVTVTLDDVRDATLRCTDDALPEEVHTASGEAALTHTLRLFGLLAEHDYTCAIDADGVSVGSVSFSTGALPSGIPELSVTGAPGWGAYTLFNHFSGATDPAQKLLIVDPEGRVRWYWFLDEDVQEGIESAVVDGDAVLLAGGMGMWPTIVSMTGEIAWRGPDPSSGGRFHHDVSMLESGDVLALAEGGNSQGELSWTGFLIEQRSPETDALVGEWSSQPAVDAGQLRPPLGKTVDPYHANALHRVDDEDGEAFLLSLSGTDQLVRLDAETGLIQWSLGAGGDFTLLDADGQPSEDWFIGQHGPHWDLPVVTLYDNRGLGQQSRALQLVLDTDAMTAQIAWQWTETDWYETVWGDTDVLPDGSVLISRGHCSFCPTADISLPTDVVEVDPATDAVRWQLSFPTREDGLYRAERYAGCDVFSNAAYCTE